MNGIGLMIGVGSATHFTICRAQGQQKDADRAFTIDEALGNAGSSRDRSFRVPSILGEEE